MVGRHVGLILAAFGLHVTATSAVLAVDVPAFVHEDRPIQDMIYWNTNFDDTHTLEATAARTRFLPPDLGFVAGVREGILGPPSTKTAPRPVWNWDRMAWARDIHEQPWMRGRGLLVEPTGSTVYEGEPAYAAEWERNIRWKHYMLATRFPTHHGGIIGWLHTNEPDNLPLPGQGHAFVRDFADKMSAEARAASIERNVRYARVVYEQLRAIQQPPEMRAPAHPGFFVGPCGAYPSYACEGTPNQAWSAAQFLSYNAGEVIDYYDGIDWHYHNVGSSEIESFDDEPPRHLYSPYHVWHALADANSARMAAGKAPRPRPMVTGETGWGEKNVSYYPPGRRGDTSVYYPDLEAYKGYKLGTQLCGLHWFGISMWAYYSLADSHAPTDYNSLSDAYEPKSHHAVALDIQDWRRYDINGLDKHPLEFAQKPWQDFNRPYSWAVHYAASRYPTAADFPPAPAFPEWRTVTFRDGSLEMGPRDGRNLVYRPIYLRRLVPHRFEVDVTLTGGAKVKLRARGFDKLDGLAQVVDARQANGTLRVTFTPRQHEMGHGLPDPAYVLIALDHDGQGTAIWSRPRLIVEVDEKPGE